MSNVDLQTKGRNCFKKWLTQFQGNILLAEPVRFMKCENQQGKQILKKKIKVGAINPIQSCVTLAQQQAKVLVLEKQLKQHVSLFVYFYSMPTNSQILPEKKV